MIRDTKPNYQTAAEAIKVIRDAEERGGSVSVNKDGTLKRVESSANPFKRFLFFIREKLGFESKDQILERKAMIVEVVSKMHREIHQASSHIENVNNLLKAHIHDLNDFKNDGQVRQLQDQWTILKTTVDEAERGSEKSQALLKHHNEKTIPNTASKSSTTQETLKSSEIRPSDSSPSPARTMTARINEALPASIKFSGDYSEPVVFTLTLPENQQKEIFASLTNETTFIPPEPKPDQAQKILSDKRLAQSSQKNFDPIEPDDELEYDPFFDDDDISDGDEIVNKKPTQISTQLWKDFGRSTFILIDEDNLQITHGLGADPSEILQSIKSMVIDLDDNSGKILQTLSHLPNQTTVGAFLTPLKSQNASVSGNPINHLFDDTIESPIRKKETFYTIKKYANGDFECGFLKREKIEHIIHSDGSMIPVNSQPQRKGHVSPENFGYEISGKIQISQVDLSKGSLANVKIIEPVRLKYQLQFDEPSA
jgi:hypothetical protein